MYFNVSKELYAHIDCDCFYASCEILRTPSLRWKCVCVGGDIIITSSYEARKYGVKVGTPIWEARKMIPEKYLVILPPDMNFYGKMSQKIASSIEKWTNSIEQFSIDEYWVNITWIPQYKKMNELQFATFLQKEILTKTGLPVSIGVSNTRLRAKILSDVNKPLWVCIWGDMNGFLGAAGSLPLKDIPFIGPASQEKLRYPVPNNTISGFLDLWFWKIKELLGRNGANIWLELKGINTWQPKKEDEHEKSISATRSFNHDKTSDKQFLWQHLMMNFERAYSRLIEKNLQTNHISLSFRRNKEWEVFWRDKRLYTHTQRKQTIMDILLELFEASYTPDILYRTTGVTFFGLQTTEWKQYSFDDQPHIQTLIQDQKLEKIINTLNHKYWRGAVSRGGGSMVDPRYMAEHLSDDLMSEERDRLKYMVNIICT